ncbi:MAG: hypothetical protein JWR29_55 [Tardiphaga sp.]|nr:hypothetical protein [Tardiphaga sp.]
MNRIAKAAGLLVALSLAGCGMSSMLESDRGDRGQPFPSSFKTELLAFLRTYLKDPVGVRDASMAEPVQRTVNGQLRYVSCLKYNPRETDGSYRGVRERAVSYIDGRLDRMVDDTGDLCVGATYTPFPELQILTR